MTQKQEEVKKQLIRELEENTVKGYWIEDVELVDIQELSERVHIIFAFTVRGQRGRRQYVIEKNGKYGLSKIRGEY
jgi:hypothetical protein